MFKKIIKRLTNNLGLKIISALMAIALWLVVINVDNPEKSKPFSATIKVMNADVLENMGLVYDIVESGEKADFYVRGKRTIVDSLTSSNFEATADLGQIDFTLGKGVVIPVPIEIKATKYENQLAITKKTVNMQIKLEDLSTSQFVISPVTQGEPLAGYAIGDKTVAPNLLQISGPQSIVSKISKVVANIDVEGLSTDVSARVPPVLYDEDNNVIMSEQLKLSQEEVAVSVKILGTKSIPVYCETNGNPAEGYQYTGLEFEPKKVTIKGEPGVLNGVTEVRIPGAYVQLEGVTADVSTTVDIAPLLAEKDVSLVNADDSIIAIKATIEKEETKVLELPTADIKYNNLLADYRLEYIVERINITVQGLRSKIEQLTVESLNAAIDVGGLTEGVHVVDIQLNVGAEYLQDPDAIKVQVRIVKKDAEPDTGTGNGAGSGTGNETGSGTGNEADNSSGQNNNPTIDTMTPPKNEEDNNTPRSTE